MIGRQPYRVSWRKLDGLPQPVNAALGTHMSNIDEMFEILFREVRVIETAEEAETTGGGGSSSTVEWDVLTNGDATTPELIFADGDVIMTHIP